MSNSTNASSTAATEPKPPSGRLAVLTAYAFAVAAIPIPVLPDRLLLRIRGAAVHDVASRHGLSLGADAREALARPNSEGRARMIDAAESVVRHLVRRFRPIIVLDTLARGVEAYALGLLLERYLANHRPSGTTRISIDEARRVRSLVDRAVLRALSPSLQPTDGGGPEAAEDLRDDLTRWIDSFLLTGAALPGYVERRLTAAFDQVVAEHPEDAGA